MGRAMLAGWRERGLGPSVVVDPAPEAARLAAPGITVVAVAGDVPAEFAPGALVFAIKPQQAAEVLPSYRKFCSQATVLSIMAGRTIGSIAALLGEAAIVRAMPNTPAAVRQGVAVCCAGPRVSAPGRALAEELLRAVGEVAWVEDEGLLDPVTAVSGSGPAYVFLLTELLERAGVEQGLPPSLARLLARRTIIGSGALLAASEEAAAELRRAVTSPGGTTERALAILMDGRAWPAAVSEAIAAATARSRELAD
jgi:pyrroline-5-carboxylate reductase